MKKIILSSIFLIFNFLAFSQETILYLEDFEKESLVNFETVWNNQPVLRGPSQCEESGFTTAINHNSARVDFSLNSTNFLSLNPEAPCGGFNQTITKDIFTIDLSSITDQIKFKFKYFKSSTINWGDTSLKLIIGGASSDWIIEPELSATDVWEEVEFNLPPDITNGTIFGIQIELGGGEAVAVDDLKIFYGSTLSTDDTTFSNNFNIYPNPTTNILNINTLNDSPKEITIYSTLGKKIHKETINKQASLDLLNFNSGIYILQIKEGEKIYSRKIVKQ